MRCVIVGGPQSGKSTIAAHLGAELGSPVYCTDPVRYVNEILKGVNYLPDDLDGLSPESTRWIVDNWLTLPGPWIIEGVATARVLRKWLASNPEVEEFPCDRVLTLVRPRRDVVLSGGQASMFKGVMTVWNEIAEAFEDIADVVQPDD